MKCILCQLFAAGLLGLVLQSCSTTHKPTVEEMTAEAKKQCSKYTNRLDEASCELGYYIYYICKYSPETLDEETRNEVCSQLH